MFIYHCGASGNTMGLCCQYRKACLHRHKDADIASAALFGKEYPLHILSPTLPPLFCRKTFPFIRYTGDARTAALPPCSAGQSPVGAVPAPCIPSLPVKMLHRCLLHKVGIRLPAVRIHLFRCLYFSIGSAPLQSHGAGMRKRIARIYHFQL